MMGSIVVCPGCQKGIRVPSRYGVPIALGECPSCGWKPGHSVTRTISVPGGGQHQAKFVLDERGNMIRQ